jgi:regulator of protease activity HflC (stomatin/prohibitin superfamily)
VNPLYVAYRLTQRVQNLAIPTLKVNDKTGNPVEIAAVIVWQIQDTYKASYDVADYNAFVRTQSEAALQRLCAASPCVLPTTISRTKQL